MPELLESVPMDKTIKRYASLGAMKAAEYRDWQRVPARERMQAVADLTLAAYRMTGGMRDVPRLQRTLVRLQLRGQSRFVGPRPMLPP